MKNASTGIRRDIDLGIVRSTWRSRRRRRRRRRRETSTSGINVIEINIAVSSSDSWVFDTRSMMHTWKLL
jgi:hypothetical protein